MKRPVSADDPLPGKAIAKMCLVGALLVLGLWILHEFIPALIWAGILWVATGPVYARLRQAHPRLERGLILPSLFTLVFAALVIVPIAIGIVEAAREWREAAAWLASARAHGVPVPAWVAQLPLGAHQASEWWQSHLASPDNSSSEIRRFTAMAMAHSRSFGGELVHRLMIFAVTLLALFFILKEQAVLLAQVRVAGAKLLGSTGERIADQVILSIRGTVNGLVFVGLGEGAVMTILYWIAGAPHPFLLGLLTAVAAMIPFGAVVMFALAALLLLVQGAVGWAIAIVVVGLIVVGIADHFVRPALIGGATRLPFLWVLLGILGGVGTLGLLGLFVGPAVMAALLLLWREFVHSPPVEQPT
jgi:predicted PurR-regulated permease PerM